MGAEKENKLLDLDSEVDTWGKRRRSEILKNKKKRIMPRNQVKEQRIEMRKIRIDLVHT